MKITTNTIRVRTCDCGFVEEREEAKYCSECGAYIVPPVDIFASFEKWRAITANL